MMDTRDRFEVTDKFLDAERDIAVLDFHCWRSGVRVVGSKCPWCWAVLAVEGGTRFRDAQSCSSRYSSRWVRLIAKGMVHKATLVVLGMTGCECDG